jgi:flavin reductase (DIM6/NTAB) family NADH-FMN oxidoreductase RutF
MLLNSEDIQLLDSRFRANLINSLAGFKTAVLVGTANQDLSQTNLAVFNSLTHIGANPPLFGLVFRPHSVRRDTLENIIQTKSYTLNYFHNQFMHKVHQTSAKYPKEVSEFDEVELNTVFVDGIHAPFAKEASIKIAMSLEQMVPIELNDTILLIGSIQKIMLPDNFVENDGFVPLHNADILACIGLDAYYKTELIDRLPYAKP